MKAEEVGNFSDALFFMEQHGVSKVDAKTIALQIFNWGVGACLDQLRPSRPFPSDLPDVQAQTVMFAEPEPKKARAKSEPKKALHRIPADFILMDDMRQFARERAFTPNEIESMWTKFFNHYTANGETAVDWKAKWRTWVMRGVEYKQRDNPRQSHQPDGRL
jgi:hypothetical protein